MFQLVNPYVKYSYEQLTHDARQLLNQFGCVIQMGSIGKTYQNREILLFKMGTGPKKILLVGAHHGREYISSAYLMAIMEYYCQALCHPQLISKYPLSDILDKHTFYIIPMLNPDGVNLSIFGKRVATTTAMKMPRISGGYETWKANINGVDLNRHYPCLWEQKYSPVLTPASELFKGYAPATEAEVRTLMRLCHAVPFDIAITFHAKGEEIYFLDSNSLGLFSRSKPIAVEMAHSSGYHIMPVSSDPAVFAAGFENWFRAEFDRPGILIELTPYRHGPIPHNMYLFDSICFAKAKYLPICFLNRDLI